MLHLLGARAPDLAAETMTRQAAAGHEVIAVLLPGSGLAVTSPGVRVHRVPDDLSYGQLLDLLFEADRVVTW